MSVSSKMDLAGFEKLGCRIGGPSGNFLVIEAMGRARRCLTSVDKTGGGFLAYVDFFIGNAPFGFFKANGAALKALLIVLEILAKIGIPT